MSSSLHYTEDALRRQRACDACRRRKSKCRPSEIDKARCKACVESKISKCTYVAPTGRAEPTFAYVRQLEDRIESLDLLLQKYVIADKERGKDPGPTSGGAAARSSQNVQVLSQRPFQVLPLQVSPPPPRYSEVDEYSWSSTGRHFGDSSWASLVGLAYEVRNDAVPGPPGPPRRLLIRDENEYSWESETNLQDDLLVFSKLPDDSQLQNLLGIYFRHVAPFFPIIHKATLEVQCADHLHRRHVSQARLILMMCAVASIYDPESNKTPGRHPPGWDFFSIMRHRQTQFTISGAARLLDAQILALQVLYHWQAGAIHSSWIVLGSGIRLAQEVGVQEPGFAMSRGPLEAEMWKRVLWFFIYQDRFLCTILGQTELIRGEFLELELPEATLLETQNEEATTVDYFRAQLQLSQPVGLSVRLQLGSVAMFKLWGFSSKEAITEELDGTLEDWVASLPPELKWVPDTPSVVALEQAAELDAALCFARILTRDPLRAAAPTSTIFLLGPEDDAGRAAERVINVLEVLLARSPGYWSFPIAQAVAFSSLVIETRLWAAERRVDVPTDIVKTMKRLHSSALHIMNQLAASWPPVGHVFYCIDVIVHGLPPPPRHQHMLYKKAQILLDISSELSPDSELFPDPVLRISDENGPFINAANNLIRRFTPAASANTDSSPSSSLESPYSRHQSIEAQSFSLSSSSAESMLRQSSDLSIDTTPLDTPLPHAASSLGSSPNSINTPPFPVTAFALEMERFREVEGTDMQLSWHDTWKNIETVWPDYFDEMGGPGPRRNPLFASACSNTAPHPNKGAGPVAGSVAPAGPAVTSLPPPSVPNDPWVPPPGFTVPW